MAALQRLINRSYRGPMVKLCRPIRPLSSHFSATAASLSAQSKVSITFVLQSGEEVVTTAAIGQSILDVCLDNELDVEGACGGECCCSTCHVYLPQALSATVEEADEDELDMLDLAIAVRDTSRLGCQLTVDASFDGSTIHLPQ